MAQPSQPPAVTFLCGMISARRELFDEAIAPLREAIGPVDAVSEVMDFDFTDYYESETGSGLLRQFVAFAPGPTPEFLAEAKCRTNAIEADFARAARRRGGGPARPINLDPGYIEPAKLVLASMKNFAHRVYLSRGVYAEVTMLYRGRWQKLEWTFPDYASGRYDAFLDSVRRRLCLRQREAAR